MSSEHQIYEQAGKILLSKGTTTPREKGHFTLFYDDPKMRIVGLVKPDESGIDWIGIIVKLPSITQNPLIYPIIVETNHTLVYFFQTEPLFYRPGRWITYLAKLFENVNKEQVEAHTLNHNPIDDKALFPDIDQEAK